MINVDFEKPLPPLRAAIEAVQIEQEGKPMVMLRDQEGLTKNALVLSLAGFMVAMFLNGKNKFTDVQTAFNKNTGLMLKSEEVKSLLESLDKADFLETEEIQKKRKKIYQDFLDGPVRPAQFAGGGYPKDKMELAVFLGKFFKDTAGPGKELKTSPTKKEPPVGLVSPHIDYHRGGPAYAWAYQALSDSPPPDVVVALGVAHMTPRSPWVFTKKDYETPYGPMKVAGDLYDEFQKALWYKSSDEELVHRTEHSLEFQALWLKYLWKEKTPPWVPILSSSFESYCSDKPPSSIPTIEGAIQKFGELLLNRKKKGEKITILAGVDLAHVGPRFGDKEELTPAIREKIKKEDAESLKLAQELKADEFYMSVVKDGHWRKVCGLSALYVSLRLIKILAGGTELKGTQLAYDQKDDPMGGVVSFTSMIFNEDKA